MIKLVVTLDLVAGLLIGLDLLVPRKWYEWLEKIIQEYLETQQSTWGPLGKKGIVINIALILILYVGVLLYGLFYSPASTSYSSSESTAIALLSFVGLVTGTLLWIVFSGLYVKFIIKHSKARCINCNERTNFTIEMTTVRCPSCNSVIEIPRLEIASLRFNATLYLCSIYLILLFLFSYGVLTSHYLFIALIGFGLGVSWLGIFYKFIPRIIRYFISGTKIVAKMGLLIFIISKVIQLASL